MKRTVEYDENGRMRAADGLGEIKPGDHLYLRENIMLGEVVSFGPVETTFVTYRVNGVNKAETTLPTRPPTGYESTGDSQTRNILGIDPHTGRFLRR